MGFKMAIFGYKFLMFFLYVSEGQRRRKLREVAWAETANMSPQGQRLRSGEVGAWPQGNFACPHPLIFRKTKATPY